MKTASLLSGLLLASSLFVFSCKKDSGNQSGNNAGNTNSALEGKWTISSYVEKLTEPNGTSITDTTPATHGDNLVFTSSGYVYATTWYTVTISPNGDGAYSMSTSTTDQDYSSDTSAYQLKGSQLLLTTNNVTDTAQVLTLTSNQLVLYAKDNSFLTDESWIYLKK